MSFRAWKSVFIAVAIIAIPSIIALSFYVLTTNGIAFRPFF